VREAREEQEEEVLIRALLLIPLPLITSSLLTPPDLPLIALLSTSTHSLLSLSLEAANKYSFPVSD
jgi:hypothetical protein